MKKVGIKNITLYLPASAPPRKALFIHYLIERVSRVHKVITRMYHKKQFKKDLGIDFAMGKSFESIRFMSSVI